MLSTLSLCYAPRQCVSNNSVKDLLAKEKVQMDKRKIPKWTKTRQFLNFDDIFETPNKKVLTQFTAY